MLLVLLCLSITAGCGQGDRPPLGLVCGTVTLDGKPLAGTNLIFQPVEGGRASTGYTKDDGGYELIYIRKYKGAKVGGHRVRINAPDPSSGVEIVPRQYNEQSTLTAEVKSGDNMIDFALSSKP